MTSTPDIYKAMEDAAIGNVQTQLDQRATLVSALAVANAGVEGTHEVLTKCVEARLSEMADLIDVNTEVGLARAQVVASSLARLMKLVGTIEQSADLSKRHIFTENGEKVYKVKPASLEVAVENFESSGHTATVRWQPTVLDLKPKRQTHAAKKRSKS